MECKRCGNGGAERMEKQYGDDATVVVYLCESCAASVTTRDDVDALDDAPEQ